MNTPMETNPILLSFPDRFETKHEGSGTLWVYIRRYAEKCDAKGSWRIFTFEGLFKSAWCRVLARAGI
jgi:hypothetical protein